MYIFKQLLLLFAVLLANSLSLDAVSSGDLMQNLHAAVLDSRQPQQCGHFQSSHRGASHGVSRHFSQMGNRRFIHMGNPHFVHMGHRHFILMGHPHFVPMHKQGFVQFHRVNNFEVIRGRSFSNEPFVLRHVHFVRVFDPHTGQFVIREFAQ